MTRGTDLLIAGSLIGATLAGCAGPQAGIQVDEVSKEADGSYTLRIQEGDSNLGILPSRIRAADGVYLRQEGDDPVELINATLLLGLPPSHKIEAFGGTYVKQEEKGKE